jgi:hypothetical protein
MEFTSLEEIYEKYPFKNECFYIAHLLDRILVGIKDDKRYDELKQAIADGELLELHLFNEEKEIFIARESNEIWVYEPLFHDEEERKYKKIDRCYKIDSRFSCDVYKWLEVREYVEYDKTSHIAYVKRTGLYKLRRDEM